MEKPTDLIRPDVSPFDVANELFFRLDSGPLIAAELSTRNGDVPKGAPILQCFCYELPLPYSFREIEISAWQHTLTANIDCDGNVVVFIYFSKWGDGWLLAADPVGQPTRSVFRGFIRVAHEFFSSLSGIRDLRWFRSGFLTCGLLHDGDFERGIESPFLDAEGT